MKSRDSLCNYGQLLLCYTIFKYKIQGQTKLLAKYKPQVFRNTRQLRHQILQNSTQYISMYYLRETNIKLNYKNTSRNKFLLLIL